MNKEKNSPIKQLFQVLAVISLLVLILNSKNYAAQRPEKVLDENYKGLRDNIAEVIQGYIDQKSMTCVGIALVNDQKIVWAEGFGYADKEKKIPATAETLYRVASITKVFTGTAVMQLAEKGLVDIDKPFKTYLSEFSMKTHYRNQGEITTRQILTHHSGLPRD